LDDPMSPEAPLTNEALDSRAIDAPRVTAWLQERLPDVEPPLRFTRVGEGQSNLTFRVDDAAGSSVVLRRPPLGEILASAHDMAREHRILSALAPAGARVPFPLAICEDPEVTGAPFYVMEYVDGLIPARVETAKRLSPEARRTAALGLVMTLAELQALDVDTVGLGDFKRPESLIARQLRRWTRQWHASKTRELPEIETLAELLVGCMPEERETVLHHGDYRLDNAVLSEEGEIRAVLDWELCTVGDPLADVGMMIAYWNELGSAARLPDALFREPVTELPGFPSGVELANAYGRVSGRDPANLGFWIAFAYWKIAIIVEGVYRRWLNDPSNGTDAGTLQPAVARLAGLARDAFDHDWETTAK
jgi:aminoglycoside phosphotransferase (APT) family kinase protein